MQRQSRMVKPLQTSKTSMTIFWTIVVLLMLLNCIATTPVSTPWLEENATCGAANGMQGICKTWADCPILRTLIENHEFPQENVTCCGYTTKEELICCPISSITNRRKDISSNSEERTTKPSITITTPHPQPLPERGVTTQQVKYTAPKAHMTPSELENEIREKFGNNVSGHGNSASTITQPREGQSHLSIEDLIKEIFQPGRNVVLTPPNERPALKEGQPYPTVDEVINDIFQPGRNVVQTPLNERPALRACRRILKGLKLNQTHHILQGSSAKLGQFPHLVALGYLSNKIYGEIQHVFLCAGALIDSRFVLTTAQCVRPTNSPFFVRLGVVNFTDPHEMRNAVDIPIKKIHSHQNFSSPIVYNDIAIVELERPVEYSEHIYPICLNVDVADPDPKASLWITGWSIINYELMPDARKSPVKVTPLETCRLMYKDIEGNRRARQGIIASQLCAQESNLSNDGGEFNAGGALNLILDASYRNYRLVGLVSFGWLHSIPDGYTRVAAFLDFIEDIVWPTGGS